MNFYDTVLNSRFGNNLTYLMLMKHGASFSPVSACPPAMGCFNFLIGTGPDMLWLSPSSTASEEHKLPNPRSKVTDEPAPACTLPWLPLGTQGLHHESLSSKGVLPSTSSQEVLLSTRVQVHFTSLNSVMSHGLRCGFDMQM